ncbi:MAG: carbohydrate-binding protein, partial [Porticoccaceae bacterium]|nr:carbohydrate-binding protein [Porticoccaceae bacterium]
MKILALLKALKPFGQVPKVGALLMAYFALSACGGDMTSGPVNVEPAKPAFAEPAPREETFSKLRADGTMWVNEQNEKVSLRGINLGNWLMMEMWMFGGEEIFGSGIDDQCSFEDALENRFGESEKDRIFKLHRDSWITERDWDVMENADFNLVRIPFPYDLIEDDDNPMTLKSDAWDYLDWAIAEAKKREMYVVLDLHGAAGRQGWEHHSGCGGLNQLWDSDSFRERTVWLWEKIAEKYSDEDAVAGYGVLNEPWGASPATMKDFVIELYDAVRRFDDDHIVILPGHSEGGGINEYGDPLDLGMENVAFEMHFYPGIFGWGDIGYDVHRDWLTCGPMGDSGVCSWASRLRDVYTPILIGEMQSWTSLGEFGGEVTRATFDRYNELNWATTAWSLKTVSGAGGLGAGPWGLMTNPGDQLLVKGSTWACDDWESTFGDACDVPARSTIPNPGTETQTMYLVLKTGSFKGTDIIYDEIKLTNDLTGENIVLNSDFGDASHWQTVSLWNNLPTVDFNYAAGDFAGSDTGSALQITAPTGGHNVAVYQAVQVEAGASYTISGKFKDLGGSAREMWSEIYLVPTEPQQNVDVKGTVLNPVSVYDSSIEEIEAFFTQFAEMEYVVNHWVVNALTREEPAQVYNNIPASPSNFRIQASDTENVLNWDQAEGQVDGYRVYRSTSSSTGFEVVAELDATTTSFSEQYGDGGLDSEVTYYYYISGYNSTDESYPSDVEATGKTIFLIPGKFEAESFAAAHPGVQIETVGDNLGGGFNIGHFETDRWVEYNVFVINGGTYTADFRLASLVGDVQFEIQIDGAVVGTVTVPNTGGWQDYQTVSLDVDLPAGESVLRLHSLANQWNLNWVEFELSDSNSGPSDTGDSGDSDNTNSTVSDTAVMTEAFGGAIYEGETFTFPSNAEDWAGVANMNTELYPFNFVDGGYLSFTGSVPSGDAVDVRFRFEYMPYPDVDPAYDTQSVNVSGAIADTYNIFIPSQGAKSFSSLIMYVEGRDIPVAISNIVVTSFGDAGANQDADDSSADQDSEETQDVEKYAIANPTSVTNGSNAIGSIVTDTELSKDVVELEVLASDNFAQGYVGFSIGQEDFTTASKFEFKVLDQQGSNTVYVTLVDAVGATWSYWTDNATPSVQNAWATIAFDYTAAASVIDLTQVAEVRFAEWNSGSYRFSDLALLLSSGEIETGNSSTDQDPEET